jgi:carotenoid cleavage dioxygenase-like enzyme
MIHLEGNNGPVPDERDSSATHVVGAVPEDLVGVFYRNGPNPRSGWSPHMFAGDGMVHALELPSGRYRNRYVRTRCTRSPAPAATAGWSRPPTPTSSISTARCSPSRKAACPTS